MTQLFFLTNQESKQLSAMKRYLRQNAITKELSFRVIRNAQAAQKMQKERLPAKAVGIEDLVSLPIQIEVHFEMYSPFLAPHPFFAAFLKDNGHVVRKVCHSAMSTIFNSLGDVIFHFGEAAEEMLIVSSGSVRYTWGAFGVEDLTEGSWISEPVLWTNWAHRGSLLAKEDCRCCRINAAAFQEIMGRFHLNRFDPIRYAEAFVNFLSGKPAGEVNDLPFAQEADLPDEMQMQGENLLPENLRRSRSWANNTFSTLLPSFRGSCRGSGSINLPAGS
jgi:hypothetical protein